MYPFVLAIRYTLRDILLKVRTFHSSYTHKNSYLSHRINHKFLRLSEQNQTPKIHHIFLLYNCYTLLFLLGLDFQFLYPSYHGTVKRFFYIQRNCLLNQKLQLLLVNRFLMFVPFVVSK